MESRHKILIVDDHASSQEIMKIMLEKKGFIALTANDGFSALELFKEKKDIDLVLLDIQMPGISGIEVLMKIRKSRSTIECPIIMLTAFHNDEMIIECLSHGANDYLTKPIEEDITFARINTHINSAKLHQDALLAKKLQVTSAMITTYNHEINNPLTIAMSSINSVYKTDPQPKLEVAQKALERIRDIVKKIRDLEDTDFETESYSENRQMITFKKD